MAKLKSTPLARLLSLSLLAVATQMRNWWLLLPSSFLPVPDGYVDKEGVGGWAPSIVPLSPFVAIIARQLLLGELPMALNFVHRRFHFYSCALVAFLTFIKQGSHFISYCLKALFRKSLKASEWSICCHLMWLGTQTFLPFFLFFFLNCLLFSCLSWHRWRSEVPFLPRCCQR